MTYFLEKTPLGIHYYSAVSGDSKMELQVTVHDSFLITKICFTEISKKENRIPVTKSEFDAAFESALNYINENLKKDSQAPDYQF